MFVALLGSPAKPSPSNKSNDVQKEKVSDELKR